MKVSTKGRYALRMMLDLAQNSSGVPISLKDIAARQGISDKYLEQIISILNKAGYVRSIRGAQGGYLLRREAKDYTVGMILRLTEGSLAPVFCVDGDEVECERQDSCATVVVWDKVNTAINDVVDNITLQDLIDWQDGKGRQGEGKKDALIYMDNAATTRTYPEVVEAMLPYYTQSYGNPSSVYGFANTAKKALDEARGTIADFIGAKPEEIYFTGGGSESDNWALKAAAEAYAFKGKHIITTKIEHHAILHTAAWLERQGYEVTYLDVDEDGIVKPEELEKAIRPDTILISVMAANNEIGTIEPIRELGAIAKKHGILFHTDAVQAFGHIPLHVDDMNIDMLSASAHKINGPKGVGMMYIRTGVKIRSFVHGGAQERARRAGTQNIPGIVGMSKAVSLAAADMEERASYEKKLRDHLIARVLKEIPYSRLNGHPTDRLPNNANFCFRFIEGESMLMLLDQNGICGSSGSACTSGSLDPSHVLLAIGLPHEIAHGSLRLTLSEQNTMEEIDFVVDKLKGIIERLRSMSPLYEDFVKQQKPAE